MDFERIADELYGLPPREFVRRRGEFAKKLRGDGERGLAQSVSQLRRPTLAAWAINQWARADPDGVDDLLTLGSELAGAQRRASAELLRTLSARRAELITRSVAAVAKVAGVHEATFSEAAAREVTQTLRAALADDRVADAVRRGRLAAAAEYSGFGPAAVFVVPEQSDDDSGSRSDSVSAGEVSETVGSPAVSAERAVSAEQIEVARSAVSTAEAVARDADTAVARRQHELDAAEERVAGLAERAESLRAELARCDDELRFARKVVEAAHEEHQRASQVVRDSRDRLDEARRLLDDLGGPTARADRRRAGSAALRQARPRR
ncbi:hypothetical protein [Gordonia rhizosphera]|uniref:Uncharacterized protein n=1 Tax=Gordonia rhizosphera NBRC 16068 TaxID=1108045 RepID=K6V0K8_9ACTN|nr:hypothetical protein [Gordonia rhizosphera]GAB89383.1 hypothetical protein GORHZ_060_00150 [Gordonia rhizosphera NBRC 16068]